MTSSVLQENDELVALICRSVDPMHWHCNAIGKGNIKYWKSRILIYPTHVSTSSYNIDPYDTVIDSVIDREVESSRPRSSGFWYLSSSDGNVSEENPNNLMMRRAGSLQELTQESWLKELGMQLMRICSQRQDKFVCMCKKALVKLNNVWAEMLSNLSFKLTVQICLYINPIVWVGYFLFCQTHTDTNKMEV